ncbi:MAG: TIGR04141 family sporadically distributed protein [Polynucleobacter sp.]
MKAKSPKKYPLSIYLLNEDLKDAKSAIKQDGNINHEILLVNGKSCDFYYKKNFPKKPTWVSIFEKNASVNVANLSNTSTGAALIYKFKDRLYALVFGHGRHLLTQDSWEENFGLKIVLNSVDPEKIRSLDVQSLDAVPVQMKSQAGIATDIDEFGFNFDKDLIRAATGKASRPDLGDQISGKDPLRLSIPFEIDDIEKLLGIIVDLHQSTKYKERFPWVDNLREVRSKSLREKLDKKLTAKIIAGDFNKTWLTVPDVIDWSLVEGFAYNAKQKKEPITDISWESYIESLPRALTDENIKRDTVYAVDTTTGLTSHRWSIYKCIYAEISDSKNTYALNNGKWYKVDQSYLSNIENAIGKIGTSSLILPDYIFPTEKEYNEFVAKSSNGKILLLDRKLINRVEICDLLTQKNELIHVKRYGGSSVLSHLFSQGLVSTNLLLSDEDFCKKAKSKHIHPPFNLIDANNEVNRENIEVVFAVASNDKAAFPDLPLFSKITLKFVSSQLHLMGVKCSLLMIKIP